MLQNEIYNLIQEDLARVEDNLKKVSEVDFEWLAKMLSHSLQSGGKRIRPALTLLAGKSYNYNLKYLIPMATAVELMHTATLVHDDAIDKSYVRRNRPTVYKLWGNEQAILLGDYLFAKAGEVVTYTESIRAIRLFTQTLMTISSGEINQAINAFRLKQTRDDYYRRIYSKTASLFSLAAETGAILSQAPESSVTALKQYAHNLGIAFQIVDDILDFTSTEQELGKPIGSDLAQGTLTLPAILIIEHYPEDNPVKRIFEGEKTTENIQKAIDMVRNTPIADECYQIATDFYNKALEGIKSLPDNKVRQILTDLAHYILSRKK